MAGALLNGALDGGLLGLAAAGFTALWRVTGVLNLAQGALMISGAYATWVVAQSAGPLLGICAAVLLGAVLGYALQRGLLNLLPRQPAYLELAGTFGVGLVLDALATLLFSGDYRSVSSIFGATDLVAGPAQVQAAALVAFACALAATYALHRVLRHTRFGLALRAASVDHDAGRLAGLPVPRLFAIAGSLSAAAAALAGGLLSLTGPFTASDGNQLLVLIAAAALIGGAGNLWSAFTAAVALGAIEGAVGYLAPAQLTDDLALAILLVAFALRALGARGGARGGAGGAGGVRSLGGLP